MKRFLLIALIVPAILLAACGTKAQVAYEEPLMVGAPAYDYSRAPVPSAPEALPTMAPYTQGSGDSANYAQPPAQDRMVIRNADLAIVIADPKLKMEQISAMAERMGGFVVNSNMYQTTAPSGQKVPQGSITIRVPAIKLTEALNQIKADAVEISYENVYGQDVTQEYVDLQSRLRNLQQAEQQLSEIMDKATETEDVISVFNQLTYYREQIEVVKGQMQYYEQSAALSAISVQLTAEETIQPLEIAGWQPKGIARDAVQSLINFFQGFVNFLIWLSLFILPALILIALPVLLVIVIVRATVRRRKARAAK